MAEGVIRLGYLDFLNVLPVYQGLSRFIGRQAAGQHNTGGPGYHFQLRGSGESPAELNRLLDMGAVEVAPASSVAFLTARGRYRFIPGIGVSSRGPVGSVILFARCRPVDLQGRVVVLPENSATSVALLRILCRRLWRVEPAWRSWGGRPDLAGMLSVGDAALLIGDEALRCRFAFPHLVQVDLGQAWFELTGLPMVFSVWTVRSEWVQEEPEAAAWAFRRLVGAQKEGVDRLPNLLPVLAEERGVPLDALQAYYRDNLDFSLGPEHLRGLGLFGRLVREEGLGRHVGEAEGGLRRGFVGRATGFWAGGSLLAETLRREFDAELAMGGACPSWERVVEGGRLGPEDALVLLERADFLPLGMAAGRVRARFHPGRVVTFVVDRNINYSNICVARCRFCAFHRRGPEPDAYVLTIDEVLAKVGELVEAGGTQVLMQGGLHPDLPFDYYLSMVRAIKQKFPSVDVHSFSPPEVFHFSRMYGMPVRRVLRELKEAGLDSLPGAGAEILVDRVRKRVSPRKIGWREWAEVMMAAAEEGLKATATMMFGHIETLAERVLHLARIREIQDQTAWLDGGVFRAFIPWTFQPANTRLPVERTATAYEYLRLVAVARLFLDNIPNIQASWVTQGPRVGQLALAFGCNDMGGTMMEENVVREAGTSFSLDVDEMVRIIRAAGMIPAKRNTRYEILRLYEE